jgi:predicted unusual protein kinase regulating ubiquinone biosynthesis (AarF/ABC1/UbiB family)
LRACFTATLQNDAPLFLDGLEELGFIGEDADRNALEQAISALLARFTGVPMSQLGQISPDEALHDVGDTLYDQPFRLPAEFAFFGRAVGMLAGLTASLTPNFNFMEVAAPYAKKLMGGDGDGVIDGLLSLLGASSLQDLALTSARETLALARSLARLPRQLERVLIKVEKSELLLVDTFDRRDTKRRRGRVTGLGLLSSPAPMWAPLGVAGAWAAVTLFKRLRARK